MYVKEWNGNWLYDCRDHKHKVVISLYFTPPPTHTHCTLIFIAHSAFTVSCNTIKLGPFQLPTWKYIPTTNPTLIPPGIFPPRSVFHYMLWTVSHILDVLKPPENWCCMYDKHSWISSAANFLGPRGNFFYHHRREQSMHLNLSAQTVSCEPIQTASIPSVFPIIHWH